MKLRFRVTFKEGPRIVAEVLGREDAASTETLTVKDVAEDVIAAEQIIERLTGLRVHIEQVR